MFSKKKKNLQKIFQAFSQKKGPQNFFQAVSKRGQLKSRGGVLEDILGLEDTFSSPWPGLEALGPRKLPCPRLEDGTIFLTVEVLLENTRNLAENLRTPFLFFSIGALA